MVSNTTGDGMDEERREGELHDMTDYELLEYLDEVIRRDDGDDD